MLPCCFVEYRPFQIHPPAEEGLLRADGLSVMVHNYHLSRHVYQDDAHAVLILGAPIIGDAIDCDAVRRGLCARPDEAFFRSLNGEFLLFSLNRQTNVLRIVNDRFSSIPLYYAVLPDRFLGSVFYNHLWLRLREDGSLRINTQAFFEFLWLQRLLGTKTYDRASRFLPAATCLAYDGTQTTLTPYWKPSFAKTSRSVHTCARDLGQSLQRSIQRKTSDGPKTWGLFLSGGLDSRTILAAFEKPPVCFTVAFSENNECRIGREVARARDARHLFIQLDPDLYVTHLDAMVRIGGGMYAFDHALFFGACDVVASNAQVVFHGHGVDYLFQGMYVPVTAVQAGPVKTYFRRLRELSSNLVDDYLFSISFRLQDTSPLELLKPAWRDEAYAALRGAVQEILAIGEGFCNTAYDFWEYLLIHALSRHYPNTNLTSMAICAEQRTATFDNDVFDLYLSLPAAYRLQGRIAKETLRMLNPRLAGIRTANTNMPAGFSPWQQQIAWLKDMVLVKAGLQAKSRYLVPAAERTWPDRDRVFWEQPELRLAALALSRSEALDGLGLLDMDRIAALIHAWAERRHGGGKLVASLMTLDRFLRQ